jgi:hypothetical protein
MILLPYIHNVRSLNGIPVHSYTILTIGGTTLWSEEISKSEIESMLQENDLYCESIRWHKDIALCAINTQKTKLTDFFNWSEITDPSIFCWRTLYQFGKKQNWLPHPNESMNGYSYQALCTMICEKDI